MKSIQLSRGAVILVDDDDYHWLSQWTWRLQTGRGKRYAVRQEGSKRKRRTILMHRELLRWEIGGTNILVDHRDGNGLNNQRGNLRLATYAQNLANSIRKRTKFRGVAKTKGTKWLAYIGGTGGRRHIGTFASEIEAARAYDEAAAARYGEFARLNLGETK